MQSLTLAIWNIAAGRTSRTKAQFDYNPEEDMQYFIDVLKEVNADVVCLQEVHTSHNRSQAKEVFDALNGTYLLNSVAHPSHIDSNFEMGNAIISKLPVSHTKTIFFPNPWFDMYFKDGRKAIEHPKNVQLVQIGNIWIGNLHLLPLRLFGLQYNDGGLGQELSVRIEKTLLALPANLILSGDFNFPEPEEIYPNFIKERGLQRVAFAMSSTDHTFIPKGVEVISSKIIETRSDHNLHIVELKL